MKLFERLKTGTFILQRYVARSYMSAFFLGLVLLTFVLSIGLLVRAARLVVMGLEPALLVDFFAVSIPELLSYTVPLAALVSALLVFGRLSGDGEISAMRACGINIWSIMTPLVVFGALLAALTIYINGYIAPRGNDERHVIQSRARDSSSLKILQPGQYIKDFPGQTFWFASKEGELLKDVRIYEYGKKNPDFTREIRAESAYVTFTNTVTTDSATGAVVTNSNILLDLNNVRIEPISETQPGVLTAANIKHFIPDSSVNKQTKKKRKPAADTNDILLAKIGELETELAQTEAELADAKERYAEVREGMLERARGRRDAFYLSLKRFTTACRITIPDWVKAGEGRDDEDFLLTFLEKGEAGLYNHRRHKAESTAESLTKIRSEISERKTEFNRRWAFGLAPFAFILIGMPLGIRTSRKESNIGIAISLGIMIVYYAFVILGKSLSKHPECFPHILIWTPSVICAVIAVSLIRRNQ